MHLGMVILLESDSVALNHDFFETFSLEA